MYFCYVDESGDSGTFNADIPAKACSPHFIMAGLIVPAGYWKYSLDIFKNFRKKLAAQCYLPYDIEIHCAELIDPRKIKQYTQLNTADRWKIIEDFAEKIGGNNCCSIITTVIDKTKSILAAEEYLTTSITKLYQAFDQFLKEKKQTGIVLFDRANDKLIQTHVRKLMDTGSSGNTIPGVTVNKIIEDPFFRISTDSIFIQAADVIAYTLKEREFPQTSRKKFNADRIFNNKLNRLAYHSIFSDADGVVRL